MLALLICGCFCCYTYLSNNMLYNRGLVYRLFLPPALKSPENRSVVHLCIPSPWNGVPGGGHQSNIQWVRSSLMPFQSAGKAHVNQRTTLGQFVFYVALHHSTFISRQDELLKKFINESCMIKETKNHKCLARELVTKWFPRNHHPDVRRERHQPNRDTCWDPAG